MGKKDAYNHGKEGAWYNKHPCKCVYRGGGKGAVPPSRPVKSELPHFSKPKRKSEEH